MLIQILIQIPGVSLVSRSQGSPAFAAAIQGQVVDQRGATLRGMNVTLEGVGGVGVGHRVRTATADGEGVFKFEGLAAGHYRITVSGVCKDKVVDVSIGDAESISVRAQMCLVCEDEKVPNMELTDADRATILSYLAKQAFGQTKLKILLDSVKRGLVHEVLSPDIEILRLGQIQERSRQKTIEYVQLAELKSHGSCVEGSYTIGCMFQAKGCPLGGQV